MRDYFLNSRIRTSQDILQEKSPKNSQRKTKRGISQEVSLFITLEKFLSNLLRDVYLKFYLDVVKILLRYRHENSWENSTRFHSQFL